MKVLLTGGAGYIGSHTAKALARAGHEPVVFDNLSSGRRAAVRWGPLVEADLADRSAIDAALQAYGVDAVIHCAASIDIGESVRDPRAYYRNNVVNTVNLLDAILDAGGVPIVFSSSCATYGAVEWVPVAEDHPQRPINPYGETKLAIERMLRAYGDAYGLRWMALRYFNAAGADPDGETGSNLEADPGLIPRVIRSALGQDAIFEIYGTDYPTPDGTCVRDYVHVSDLAEAHVTALCHLVAGGPGGALNLGSGSGASVREVVAAVERVSGRHVPSREGRRRLGDAASVVADPSLAMRLLRWQPRHSTLDEIVRTAWNWRCGHRPPASSRPTGASS